MVYDLYSTILYRNLICYSHASIVSRCLCIQTVVISALAAFEYCDFLNEIFSFDLFIRTSEIKQFICV